MAPVSKRIRSRPSLRRSPRPTLAAGLVSLDVGVLPLVLVVGVHVPRKNHVAILEAADRLWSAGTSFELLFVGGMDETSGGQFDGYVDDLRARGRPSAFVGALPRASCGPRTALPASRSTRHCSRVSVCRSRSHSRPERPSSHRPTAPWPRSRRAAGRSLVDPRNVDDLEDRCDAS